MITLDAIALPSSLHWTDRDDWQPVRQVMRMALDGTPAIYHSPMPSGRPITLQSAEDSGWVTRATLDALQALASVPGATHALTLDSQAFAVLWRHDDAPAISAKPLLSRINPAAGDYFIVTLKFTAL